MICVCSRVLMCDRRSSCSSRSRPWGPNTSADAAGATLCCIMGNWRTLMCQLCSELCADVALSPSGVARRTSDTRCRCRQQWTVPTAERWCSDDRRRAAWLRSKTSPRRWAWLRLGQSVSISNISCIVSHAAARRSVLMHTKTFYCFNSPVIVIN